MTVREGDEAVLAAKFAVMRRLLDEREWRLYLGTEARALGHGGIAAVARASGVSETTVAAGLREAAAEDALAALEPGRSRRPGAGRPKAEDAQPGLRQALDGVLEDRPRGDPMAAITWNILSLRDIGQKMAAAGVRGAEGRGRADDAGGGVQPAGQRPGPSRAGSTRTGTPSSGTSTSMVAAYQAAGRPGDQRGHQEEGAGRASITARGRDLAAARAIRRRVRDHDFAGPDSGQGDPVRGLRPGRQRRVRVNVGTDHDTAAFAVESIRRWWDAAGSGRLPGRARGC